jgi:hypothetical protein
VFWGGQEARVLWVRLCMVKILRERPNLGFACLQESIPLSDARPWSRKAGMIGRYDAGLRQYKH